MNWESFHWETWLWIGAIALFLWLCCGGMLRGGGCCGIGSHKDQLDDGTDANRELTPDRRA